MDDPFNQETVNSENNPFNSLFPTAIQPKLFSPGEEIVGNMSLEELKNFVYDELYGEMLEDEEVFQLNLEKI